MQLVSLANRCFMSSSGAVQLFILETLSRISVTMMVTGSCSCRLLWSAIRSTSHGALVLYNASFSHMLLHYCSFSPSHLVTLPLRVHFAWFSGEHCIYSPDFSFSTVPSQVGSQNCESLFGSLQCFRYG